MKLEYANIAGKNYLVAEGVRICPEYMIEMFGCTRPHNLIGFSRINSGKRLKLLYETDISMTMKEYLSRNGMDENGMKLLLIALDGILAVSAEYLVDEGYILLDLNNIFTNGDLSNIRFVFYPFEKNEFKLACRKLLVDILGNYYAGYSLSGEKIREKILKEIKKQNFCIRSILAYWNEIFEKRSTANNSIEEHTKKNSAIQPSIFRGLKEKLSKHEEYRTETRAIVQASNGMCLTGICSMNAKIPIVAEGVTIGRIMLQKEYKLINNSIGKTHARIFEQEGIVYVTDLGSRNGTYVNGERLDKRVPMKVERGDIIAFSDEEFILC